MSLTIAAGPLGERPSGRFRPDLEVPDALLYFEDNPRRIRALFAEETIADSAGMKLLHERGRLPVYYFPRDDVRQDLLVRSDRSESSPTKGTATYWSVEVGDRKAPDAALSWSAELLSGFIALEWDAMDEWFAEDEQLFGHARDPYSRIDVHKSSRHIRVSRDGIVLADTRRARILFETALPPRYYIPPEDVRTELLVPSETRTRCAYKGSAPHWSVQIGERLVEDLVWSYPAPEHDAEPIRDLLCFYGERVDIEIDSEAQERPLTQWSRED